MKKTILLSSIFAIGATFADVKTTTIDINTVGVMGIQMPKKVQLVAVPFLGWNADAITINNMINTAELEVGSKLYAPSDANKYNIWTLKVTSDGRVWEMTDNNYVIDANGTGHVAVTPGAGDTTMSRGGAYWLEPKGTETSDHFFLLGKPTDAVGTSSLVANKWNLIGNTSAAAKEVPAGEADDIICVPDGSGNLTRYTYINFSPYVGWYSGLTKVAVTISPGQGIWYFSKSSKTIEW